MLLWNIFSSFSPSLWKTVMKIPGSWPACGMWYSRNVSGALCYCSALIKFVSSKFNPAPPAPPCSLWLRRLIEPRLSMVLCKLLMPSELPVPGRWSKKHVSTMCFPLWLPCAGDDRAVWKLCRFPLLLLLRYSRKPLYSMLFCFYLKLWHSVALTGL